MSSIGDTPVKILDGQLGVREMLNTILTFHPTAVVLIGHGNKPSMLFANGETLHRAVFADAISATGTVSLVIANTCQGFGFAVQCYNAGVGYAIGWQGDVGDGAAGAYLSSFLNTFKLSENVKQAHVTGCEAVRFQHPASEVPELLNGRNIGYVRQITYLTNQLYSTRRWLVGIGLLAAATMAVEAITLLLHVLN